MVNARDNAPPQSRRVANATDRAYLRDEPEDDVEMPALATDSGMPRSLLLLLAAAGAILIAATLVLWAYFGTTVFFEMVRVGFLACF